MSTPTEITANVRAIAREAADDTAKNAIYLNGDGSVAFDKDEAVLSVLRAIRDAFAASGVKEALEAAVKDSNIFWETAHGCQSALAAINELEKNL